VYDTELQPIELVGSFGVFPRTGYSDNEDSRFVNGDDFYIGELPSYVTEPSVEGFPFLAGEMTLRQNIVLDSSDVLLQIEGDYHTVTVRVNGADVGKLMFEKEVDISKVAVVGENEIEVRFLLGNRNLMGPHHLIGNKVDGISPWSFELNGTWDEDQSKHYHVDYDIKKVFWVF
jgi:hypothetical protein